MDLNEEIARVAYELYEKDGRQDGKDQEHWLEAERIVRARRMKEQKTESRVRPVQPEPQPKKAAPRAPVALAKKEKKAPSANKQAATRTPKKPAGTPRTK